MDFPRLTEDQRYEAAKRTFGLVSDSNELAVLGQSLVQGMGPMPDEVARAFRERLAELAKVQP